MKINVLYGVPGAKKAKGLVIIVDIFRAATLAAYILNKNAKYIIPVATKEEAFLLREKNKDYILVGEEEGITIEGFDYGNSPNEVTHIDFTDKIIVHRTTQGTQGLVNTKRADEIIFGSFPVVSAILRYIQKSKSKVVSIVAMNGEGSEDEVFAQYLKQRLLGKNPDIEKIICELKKHKNSLRFLDPLLPHYPEGDLELCLKVDIFDFVPLALAKNKQLKINKVA